MSLLNIAVLCGGQSTEHEISLKSAKNIIAALDKSKYQLLIIYITHEGAWHLVESLDHIKTTEQNQVTIRLGDKKSPLQSLDAQQKYPVDCFFPVLHGTLGEDGTMQGLLEVLDKPFVAAGSLSAAMSMDKVVTKEILVQYDLPVVPWIVAAHADIDKLNYSDLKKQLGEILFVKPVHLGSSVGIHKVKNEAEFKAALADAFKYDDSILIEKFAPGREIECAVLGNENPKASKPAEIVLHCDFYDYEAKYLSANAAEAKVPADLSPEITAKIREYSVRAFKALRCAGMLRVDFFLLKDGTIYINEVNPIPGFTNISMYPKMWEESGIAYPDLVDALIQLALERYKKQQNYQRIFAVLK